MKRKPATRKKADSGTRPSRRRALFLLAGGTALLAAAAVVYFKNGEPAQAEEVVVYKSPTCGCCGEWVKHLRRNGFSVRTMNREDMDPIKEQMGVPYGLQSCHTATVGGYVVEGHVPADSIKRLLAERPNRRGLSVPGMPIGSPGMEGGEKDPYAVLLFGGAAPPEVYARY